MDGWIEGGMEGLTVSLLSAEGVLRSTKGRSFQQVATVMGEEHVCDWLVCLTDGGGKASF